MRVALISSTADWSEALGASITISHTEQHVRTARRPDLSTPPPPTHTQVLDSLASTRAFSLHAVDWLGTGLSGRPPFRARGVEQTEAFFTESLATWRDAVRGVGGCSVYSIRAPIHATSQTMNRSDLTPACTCDHMCMMPRMYAAIATAVCDVRWVWVGARWLWWGTR